MFSAWTTPRAKKEHKCDVCFRVIRPGEFYHRWAGTDGGDLRTWKECKHCAGLIALAKLDEHFEDGVGPDEIWEWMNGYVVDVTVQELRWAAYFLKKWSRKDGTLYPIPTKG